MSRSTVWLCVFEPVSQALLASCFSLALNDGLYNSIFVKVLQALYKHIKVIGINILKIIFTFNRNKYFILKY